MVQAFDRLVQTVPGDRPVLIAGPTASGKSALALAIALRHGGVVINADALQVYRCWRVLTARPTVAEEAVVPHALYGHVDRDQRHSVGDWLRAVAPLLAGPRLPVIVGGTGLFFAALTTGLAEIPPIPAQVRARADSLTLDQLRAGLDAGTAARIDLMNRARVQRAWEVQAATGRALIDWQGATGAPLLPLDQTTPLVLTPAKPWLDPRIAARFDAMLAGGALDEVGAALPGWNPDLPSSKAIGAAELVALLRGEMPIAQARDAGVLATVQYARMQRKWFRKRMSGWQAVDPGG